MKQFEKAIDYAKATDDLCFCCREIKYVKEYEEERFCCLWASDVYFVMPCSKADFVNCPRRVDVVEDMWRRIAGVRGGGLA